MAPSQCMSHSPWHLALRNFIMQIKNKLNNLIVSTFLLLFVNKIMFTKYFFLLQKGFLFAKWVLFLAKNVLFFPLEGCFFKVFFFAKVHYDPCRYHFYILHFLAHLAYIPKIQILYLAYHRLTHAQTLRHALRHRHTHVQRH